MRFRPCIDIHNGAVKQIVGGSLKDEADFAKDNFVSELKADFYADLYRRSGLVGGHIILLNPAGSTYYEADLEQAKLALAAYPQGLQIGGGINADNAEQFLELMRRQIGVEGSYGMQHRRGNDISYWSAYNASNYLRSGSTSILMVCCRFYSST